VAVPALGELVRKQDFRQVARARPTELETLDCDLELLWRKAVRQAEPPHFVVDEREIKIDISFKDSAIDGEPAGIDVVAA
jgi:hypothetical protein